MENRSYGFSGFEQKASALEVSVNELEGGGSDVHMLTRSYITILMQQVDVTKAYDLLAMFKEAGKERIDIRTILDEAAPKIKD